MKKVVLFVLVSFYILFGQQYSNGYNIVKNNYLDMSNYNFRDFRDDFIIGDYFLCVDNYDYWGQGFEFKTVAKIVSRTNNSITLEIGTGAQLVITKSNFNEFKDSFIIGKCLQFKNGFPVKFYKVKTVFEVPEDLHFRTKPDLNGKTIINNRNVDYLYYYAYKQKIVGNDKYILLGSTRSFDPAIPQDLNRILGWIIYRRDNHPVNMVLWNTNIGIRPKQNIFSGTLPVVARRGEEEILESYFKSGIEPDIDNDGLLVPTYGVKNYNIRFVNKHGQVNRWLPMYTLNTYSEYVLPVGVIEDIGAIRTDVEKIPTMKEIHIVFLLDNTSSMRPVWNKFSTTIENCLNTLLSSDFKSVGGDTISPMIKLYYYSDSVWVLNESRWIRDQIDLNYYQHAIQNVNRIPSKEYRPNIFRAFKKVIDDLGNDPLYVVVVGDAGDETYRGIDFSSIKEFKHASENNLIVAKGVRYNSELYSETDFKPAYEEFSQNFPILYDVLKSRIDDDEAIRIGEEIGKKIINDLNTIITKTTDILTGRIDLKNYNELNLESPFSANYLKFVATKLSQTGSGSFFEEGAVLIKDSNNNILYDKDVIVESGKMRQLKEACRDYRQNSSVAELKITIRRILAAFFEIDPYQITTEFLANVHLSDFWEKVVGNEEIAKRLAPELFKSDPPLNEFFINIDKYQETFYRNATRIQDKLTKHFVSPFPGRIAFIADINQRVVEEYYWVSVEDLNFFADLNFGD